MNSSSSSIPATGTDVAQALDKRENDIEAMFDRVAPRYDLLNRVLSGRLDVAWRRLLVETADVGEAGPILDCATGTGDVLFEFLDQTPYTVTAIGIDFSTAMLERARKKADKLGYQDRALFTKANMLEIPFADEAFEAVSVAFGIRNVSDPAIALTEMARVCRPGRRVLILEFMGQPASFRRDLTDFYCRTIMPLLARALAPDAEAYRYLNESRERFMRTDELLDLMGQAGLESGTAIPLFPGIATLHVATKPCRLGSVAMREGKSPSEDILP